MTKTIALSPSGKKIPCEAGQTVLAALEKNGFVIPNNCRAGACGECKLKVLKGEFDQGFILDMALSKEDRANGLGLMCMAKPISEELEIEFETKSKLSKLFPPFENLPYIVTEKNLVTPSIVKMRLRSLGNPMRFWPGQFVTMGSHDQNRPYRSYSIANCPNSEGELIFYITKNPNGCTSKWIHESVEIGDLLSLNGPYGTFIGNPEVELPVLCLANGSGLAPIMSLANAALLRGGFRYPATVLFSARTKADLFDLGGFKFLERKYRNFKFKATLTQEKAEGHSRGRITQILPHLYPDLQYYSVYIAGSKEFVEDCKNVALHLGAKPENIHLEAFVQI